MDSTQSNLAEHLAQSSSNAAKCAVCASQSTVRTFFLTHGITVPLCRHHRSGGHLRKNDGTTFVKQLRAYWTNRYGSIGVQREQAAQTHLLRIRGTLASDGPGSYSWARVRYEAERRFAAGDNPNDVIAHLRARNRGGNADVPATRTMRRWFFEGRWLVDPRVWVQRLSQTATGWMRRRPVRVSASALGMCIFQPGLAVAHGVDVAQAISDAAKAGRTRIDQLRAPPR